MQAISTGDIDLASRVMTDPDAVSPKDQMTVAEKWGIKNDWLKFVVNTATDPVVWTSFLMSRMFPTSGWLKGVVPDRFVGTANEFTGVSKYTRPVEDYFRGTTIPRLVALKQYREQQVMSVGEKIFKLMERPNWSQEMPIVSQLMEGQMPVGATGELRYLSQQLRGHMDDLWGFLKQTKQISGGFQGTQITSMRADDWRPSDAPTYLRDYLPHIPLVGEDSIIELDGNRALQKMGMGRLRGAFDAAGMGPQNVWSPSRVNRTVSNFADYQAFMNRVGGQIFNSSLFRRQRMDARIADGNDLFVTDLNQIMQRYVHSVARTYAVNAPISDHERVLTSVLREDGSRDIPTNDPIAVQIVNEGLKRAGVVQIQRPIPGTNKVESIVQPQSGSAIMLTGLRDLTRSIMGQADEGEILWSNLFSSVGNRFLKSAEMLNPTREQQVDAALHTFRRTQKYRTLSNGIASYFYSTTLGLNPWSAIQNLLQPLLTTMPALGPGPMLRGVKEFGQRTGQYAKQLKLEHQALTLGDYNPIARLNEAAQRAFNKVYPELGHIKLDARLFDIDPNSLEAVGGRGVFKAYDDFARFIMQPFTHAELANQATTFYAARHAVTDAMRRGEYEVPADLAGRPLGREDLTDWLNFEATNIVSSTQFRPGPGTRSVWQNSVPAFMRQFTSFPTRALSFMVNSTVRGAMTRAQIENMGTLGRLGAAVTGGRNLGTLARMVMYGRIVSEGVQDVLGVDVSGALGLTAPFMIAPEGQPFAPLPLPPAAGIAWGVVSAATNRDIKRLQPLELPGGVKLPIPRTLIPGGLALSRLGRVMSQWDPDAGGFVDEDRRLMYRGNTTDLLMSMMGVPLDKSRRARDIVERVQSNRDALRQYRRKYAAAAAANDFSTMDALSGQFSKAYPDLPPLSISQKDLLRYKQMASLTAVQRMVRTMGQQGRFLETQLYDVAPELLAPQTDQSAMLASLFGGS